MLDPTIKYHLIDAHNAAVKKVLNYIEENHIIWRKHTNKDNRTEHIKTQKAIFACIQHRLSREQDPQLHTHRLLFRNTMVGNKIMTIEDRFIHSNQYLFSLMYDNELANELTKRNIPIIKNKEQDQKDTHYEIEGVSQELIKHFSKRKFQIKEYIESEALSDSWQRMHAAGLASRKAKKEENLQSLETKWKEEITELGGFNIKKVISPSTTLRLEHINAVMIKAIQNLEEQCYSFSKKDLMIEVYKEGIMLGITLDEFNSVFDFNLHNNLKEIGYKILNEQPYFTTPKNMERVEYINNMLSQKTTQNFSTYEDGLAEEKITTIAKEIKDSYNWELSKGQKEAIKLMLTSSQKYIAIEGIAGSSKTTMLEQAKKLYQEEGVNVVGMAFTGKAAEALETEANIDATTIHKFLNKLSTTTTDYNTWDFSTIKEAKKPEVWIVDESSMLTDHLLSNILQASEKRQAKVIFLGDSNQLLPIGTGNGFARMTEIENEQVPTVRMKEINRQADKSALKQTVEALSGKFDNIDNKSPLSNIKDNITELPLRKSRINAIIRDYCTYTDEQQSKPAILVAQNKDRNEINARIHKRLVFYENLASESPLVTTNQYGKEETKLFSPGDKIIFTKNDYKIKNSQGQSIDVKNGQLGVITEINNHKITVKTNKNSITFDTRDYNHFDYGYAMTSFKAQGITVDNALICHDSDQKSSNTRNKIYVDVNRAKKEVKIYTDSYEKLEKQAKRFQKKITADTFSTNNTKLSEERDIKNDTKEKIATK